MIHIFVAIYCYDFNLNQSFNFFCCCCCCSYYVAIDSYAGNSCYHGSGIA
jgi:hypothetical protein